MAAASISRPSLLTDRQVRELTGLSRAQYARLIAEVAAAWETEREMRLSARPRARALGAGRKHALPFAGRLLLALMYLRWNVTMRFLAEAFGSDKDMVQRAVAELTPLLAAYGITAADGVRLDDDALAAQLRALSKGERAALIDGSFVPVPRPGKGGWAAQKQQYSPHRHRHVNTFQALTDDLGNLLWVGDACAGATHDLTAIATSSIAETLAETEVTVIADKAYIGIKAKLGLAHAFTPYRRRKKNDSRPEAVRGPEGEFNTELARQRVHVEHAIRRLKTNKILHGYRRRGPTLTDTIRACATLTTLPA